MNFRARTCGSDSFFTSKSRHLQCALARFDRSGRGRLHRGVWLQRGLPHSRRRRRDRPARDCRRDAGNEADPEELDQRPLGGGPSHPDAGATHIDKPTSVFSPETDPTSLTQWVAMASLSPREAAEQMGATPETVTPNDMIVNRLRNLKNAPTRGSPGTKSKGSSTN
jgi:hypothetical protein